MVYFMGDYVAYILYCILNYLIYSNNTTCYSQLVVELWEKEMYMIYDKEDGEYIRLKKKRWLNDNICLKVGDVLYTDKKRASWLIDVIDQAERVREEDL